MILFLCWIIDLQILPPPPATATAIGVSISTLFLGDGLRLRPTPSACRQRHHHPYQRHSGLCRKRRRLCFKLVSIWKAKLVVTCADRIGVLVFTSSSSFYSPPLPFHPHTLSLLCPFSLSPPFLHLILLPLLSIPPLPSLLKMDKRQHEKRNDKDVNDNDNQDKDYNSNNYCSA